MLDTLTSSILDHFIIIVSVPEGSKIIKKQAELNLHLNHLKTRILSAIFNKTNQIMIKT